MKRETFGSRLGFILVSAGCAIGIGNVWRFPFLVGQNGGGLFVLFYLMFLVIMGVPVLTMELAVGRASRKSAVQGYQALEPAGSKWHIHGWFCMAGCYLLMMYYTTVAGWMLDYFAKFATGQFVGMESGHAVDAFNAMLANPVGNGHLDGGDRHCRLCGGQLRPAERPGADQQVYDDRPAGFDRHPGCQQRAAARRRLGRLLLPAAQRGAGR